MYVDECQKAVIDGVVEIQVVGEAVISRVKEKGGVKGQEVAMGKNSWSMVGS